MRHGCSEGAAATETEQREGEVITHKPAEAQRQFVLTKGIPMHDLGII